MMTFREQLADAAADLARGRISLDEHGFVERTIWEAAHKAHEDEALAAALGCRPPREVAK